MTAQDCGEIFISEYVEGYGNNRALELYNPTNSRIDLSQYSVGRFSNGATQFTGIQIPVGNFIDPNSSFVIVLDKRDSVATGLETPIWNGYQLWDTCIDRVTMLPILDNDGNIVFCVQYDANGLHLYGTEYHDFLDLEGRADVYLCPVYEDNNAMYFNGNDAVALIKGTTVNSSGSNIIDVVGVIGENPETTISQPCWVDATGRYLTLNKTLVRKKEVKKGTGAVVFARRDTFRYKDWTVLSNNTFSELGGHTCDCFTSDVIEQHNAEVKVFPNPVRESFTFEMDVEIADWQITDLLGRTIIYQKNATKSRSVSLNISHLPKGVYTLVLTDKDAVRHSGKLIKE